MNLVNLVNLVSDGHFHRKEFFDKKTITNINIKTHSIMRLPAFQRPGLSSSAVLLFALPTLAININYGIAVSEGYVALCNPYWDGCTSISATGRNGTAFFFFKATMLPMSLLYFYYWSLCSKRLNRMGYEKQIIRNLGFFAVAALVLYTLSLGALGDNFRLMRRIGIIFYFTLTYLCQLLIVHRLGVLGQQDFSQTLQKLMCLFILGIGVLTLFLDVLLPNYDDYEDAFEWSIALLLHINILLAAWDWRFIEKMEVDSLKTSE